MALSLDSMVEGMAGELVSLLQKRDLTLATAESCTGGGISAAVTSVAGCSSVMLGGVVAYHNSVKSGVLGVDEALLAAHGAVSEPVVVRMVSGVARLFGADCAVATSGIAGPGGGTPEKPVGTVWVAVKAGARVETKLLALEDRGRHQNVKAAVAEAISLLLEVLRMTDGR